MEKLRVNLQNILKGLKCKYLNLRIFGLCENTMREEHANFRQKGPRLDSNVGTLLVAAAKMQGFTLLELVGNLLRCKPTDHKTSVANLHIKIARDRATLLLKLILVAFRQIGARQNADKIN